MDNAFENAELAARLISYGADPKAAPADIPEYFALLERYGAEPEFKALTKAILAGFRAQPLKASPFGFVWASDKEGVFAIRRDDYRKQMSVEDRICHGIIQLGVAAYCFPNAEELDEADAIVPARVTVKKLVDYLHALSTEMKTRTDMEAIDQGGEIQAACHVVLALTPFNATRDGGQAYTSLAGKVRHAMDFLVDKGLFRRDGDDELGAYVAKATYRIRVRELAGDRAYHLVTEASRAMEHHG